MNADFAPVTTEASALAARDRLTVLAPAAAHDERAAAQVAAAALFEEALLGALHARFAELHTVTR